MTNCNVNSIKAAVDLIQVPTRAQLIELAGFAAQLESVYVDLRKATTAHYVLDWDFAVDTSGADTRQYTCAELTTINGKTKANARDRAYITAFRTYVESLYSSIVSDLELFEAGVYIPYGIDGVGLLEKLYAYVVAQPNFKFTDTAFSDVVADATKMLAVKNASIGTCAGTSVDELTGAQADMTTVRGNIGAFGSPSITKYAPTGETSTAVLDALKNQAGTIEIKMGGATKLSGPESEIQAVYDEAKYTGKSSLNLAPTGALASAQLLTFAAGTTGIIDIVGSTAVTGSMGGVKSVLSESDIKNKNTKPFTVTDTGVVAGADLKGALAELAAGGTMSTASQAVISGSLTDLGSISAETKYNDRGSATYKLTDAGMLDGAQVTTIKNRLSTGSFSVPNAAKIVVDAAEADDLSKASKFTDRASQKYSIDGDGSALAGSTLVQVLDRLTTGSLALEGTAQRVDDTLADQIALFSNSKFAPATSTKVKLTDSGSVTITDLNTLLGELHGADALDTIVTTNVNGSLANAQSLLADTKFKQRMVMDYTDPTTGTVAGADVLALVNTSGFTGSLQVSQGTVTSTGLTQTNQLLDHSADLPSRASGKYQDGTSSSLSSPTAAADLQTVLDKLNSQGRLTTPNMSVSGNRSELVSLLSSNKWPDRGQRNFLVTSPVTTVELAALLTQLSTGKMTTGSKITGSLAELANLVGSTQISKHANSASAMLEDASAGSKSAPSMNTIAATLTGDGRLSVPNASMFVGKIAELLTLRANTQVTERASKGYQASDDVSLAQIATITSGGVQFLGTDAQVQDTIANVINAKGVTSFTGRSSASYKLTNNNVVLATDLLSGISAGNYAMTTYATPGVTQSNGKVRGTIAEITTLIGESRWTSKDAANFAFTNDGEINSLTITPIVSATSGNVEAVNAASTTIVADMADLLALAIDPRFAVNTQVSYKQPGTTVLNAQDIIDIRAKTSGQISAPNVATMAAVSTSQFDAAVSQITLVAGQSITQQ